MNFEISNRLFATQSELRNALLRAPVVYAEQRHDGARLVHLVGGRGAHWAEDKRESGGLKLL